MGSQVRLEVSFVFSVQDSNHHSSIKKHPQESLPEIEQAINNHPVEGRFGKKQVPSL
jgi:hypothetical protein